MKNKYAVLTLLILTTGCAAVPHGPSVPVMPGPGKPFDLFVREDRDCQEFAHYQSGGNARRDPEDQVLAGSVGGTLIGAALGTGLGALAGHPGEGAIIGASAGLIQGTAIGAGAAHQTAWQMQQQFNVSYQQCMYAKGNQIPGTSLAYAPVAYPPPPSPPPAPNLYNSKPPKY